MRWYLRDSHKERLGFSLSVSSMENVKSLQSELTFRRLMQMFGSEKEKGGGN